MNKNHGYLVRGKVRMEESCARTWTHIQLHASSRSIFQCSGGAVQSPILRMVQYIKFVEVILLMLWRRPNPHKLPSVVPWGQRKRPARNLGLTLFYIQYLQSARIVFRVSLPTSPTVETHSSEETRSIRRLLQSRADFARILM